jgi:hypothetical protein
MNRRITDAERADGVVASADPFPAIPVADYPLTDGVAERRTGLRGLIDRLRRRHSSDPLADMAEAGNRGDRNV